MPPKRNFRKRPLEEEEEEEDEQSKAASSEEEEKRRSVPEFQNHVFFLGFFFDFKSYEFSSIRLMGS